jgi:hypothetical protein
MIFEAISLISSSHSGLNSKVFEQNLFIFILLDLTQKIFYQPHLFPLLPPPRTSFPSFLLIQSQCLGIFEVNRSFVHD